jgi:hypothetical protein
MYNKDVVNALIREFGIENTILYCKMESRKNDLLYEDALDRGVIGSCEIEYERDWWNDEGNLLQTLKDNKNGNIKIVRKLSKNSNSNKAVVSFKNVG